jgi:hypothetical protein
VAGRIGGHQGAAENIKCRFDLCQLAGQAQNGNLVDAIGSSDQWQSHIRNASEPTIMALGATTVLRMSICYRSPKKTMQRSGI